MTKTEMYANISLASKRAEEIKDILHSIVWEGQEGQEEHFDKLNKAEKIAIIGIFNDACNLVQSLSRYNHWFIK